MSTEPTGGSGDGQVVPLRAADAGTDARLTETSAPAYADVSDGQAQRKPVIPAHWRTRDAARPAASGQPMTGQRSGHGQRPTAARPGGPPRRTPRLLCWPRWPLTAASPARTWPRPWACLPARPGGTVRGWPPRTRAPDVSPRAGAEP